LKQLGGQILIQPLTIADYARRHKLWACFCALFFLIVFFSCASAVYDILVLNEKAPLYALGAGMVGFAATAAGSIPGLFMNKLSDRTEDLMLGSAAGMMIAAAFFSLLMPALEASDKLFANEWLSMAWVIFGIFLGIVFLLGINAITPHEHFESGAEGPEIQVRDGIWLFVLAIIIHNVPEGMAMGISFAAEDMQIGVPLTAAIALQDLPEGLAVVLALCTTSISRVKAVMIGVLSGLMEPIGALFGVSLTAQLGYAYPLGLALSAGAMFFVVFHEVIPETHRRGHQTAATLGLMFGFCLLMVLDRGLG
jgi:Predicted divalent heavy-metal cations transporter